MTKEELKKEEQLAEKEQEEGEKKQQRQEREQKQAQETELHTQWLDSIKLVKLTQRQAPRPLCHQTSHLGRVQYQQHPLSPMKQEGEPESLHGMDPETRIILPRRDYEDIRLS